MSNWSTNAIVALILAVAIACAAVLLWLRDRWWDRKGVSAADRKQYHERMRRRNARVASVFHFIVAVGLLWALLRSHVSGRAIGYAAGALVFFWMGFRQWKEAGRQDQESKWQSPGAPPME